MARDRFQLAAYKADRLRDLGSRLQFSKQRDDDRAWLTEMRTRQKGEWTKADEDRARQIERESKTEGRQDVLFQQGQDDRKYGLGRRSVVDQREDRLFNTQLTGAEADAKHGPLVTAVNPKTGQPGYAQLNKATGQYEFRDDIQPSGGLTDKDRIRIRSDYYSAKARDMMGQLPDTVEEYEAMVLGIAPQLGNQRGGLLRPLRDINPMERQAPPAQPAQSTSLSSATPARPTAIAGGFPGRLREATGGNAAIQAGVQQGRRIVGTIADAYSESERARRERLAKLRGETGKDTGANSQKKTTKPSPSWRDYQ